MDGHDLAWTIIMWVAAGLLVVNTVVLIRREIRYRRRKRNGKR